MNADRPFARIVHAHLYVFRLVFKIVKNRIALEFF